MSHSDSDIKQLLTACEDELPSLAVKRSTTFLEGMRNGRFCVSHNIQQNETPVPLSELSAAWLMCSPTKQLDLGPKELYVLNLPMNARPPRGCRHLTKALLWRDFGWAKDLETGGVKWGRLCRLKPC